jgi:hypothetical protein
VGSQSSGATIAAVAVPSSAALRGSHNADVVADDAPAGMPGAGLGGLGSHATSKDEVYSTLSRIGVGAGLSFLVRRTITRRRQSKKSQTKKHRRGDDSPPAPYQMLLPAPAPQSSQPAATTRSHGLAAPLGVCRVRACVCGVCRVCRMRTDVGGVATHRGERATEPSTGGTRPARAIGVPLALTHNHHHHHTAAAISLSRRLLQQLNRERRPPAKLHGRPSAPLSPER